MVELEAEQVSTANDLTLGTNISFFALEEEIQLLLLFVL